MKWPKLYRQLILAGTRIRYAHRMKHLGRRTHLGRHSHLQGKNISIGAHVSIHSGWSFDVRQVDLPSYGIVIDDWTVAMHRFQINASVGVAIGSDCLIASGVLITDYDHVVQQKNLQTSRCKSIQAAQVRIGRGCWIGQNAVIVKGVELGDGCIVGANAVVTRSFDPGSVIAGVPARRLNP